MQRIAIKRTILFVLFIPMLLLAGCNFNDKVEIAGVKAPQYLIKKLKNDYYFNATVAFNNRVYTITDQVAIGEMMEEQIGKVKRKVSSEAFVNGDYGLFMVKKKVDNKALTTDAVYQKVYDTISKQNTSNCEIYKVASIDTNYAIALKHAENEYRIYTSIGELNGFYKEVNSLIKPIYFVPFLLLLYFATMLCFIIIG